MEEVDFSSSSSSSSYSSDYYGEGNISIQISQRTNQPQQQQNSTYNNNITNKHKKEKAMLLYVVDMSADPLHNISALNLEFQEAKDHFCVVSNLRIWGNTF
jgi:hypothetical protein